MLNNIIPRLGSLLLTSSILLSACGGGGGSNSDSVASSDPDADEVSINGSAVKGPVTGATVSLYTIDWSAADLKGSLIGTGTTDANAHIQDLVINTRRKDTKFLIEIDGTNGIDITTGEAPLVPVLRTILTLNDLYNIDPNTGDSVPTDLPIFASPLSTFAVDIIAINGMATNDSNGDGVVFDAEIDEAIKFAQDTVKASFGLGLLDPEGTGIAQVIPDLFTTASVYDDNSDQSLSLKTRTANEIFAAIIVDLNQQGTASPGEIIKSLASDLLDGTIDGIAAGEALPAFAGVNVYTTVTQDPNALLVPGTSIPMSEINMLMESELTLMGSTVEVDPEETSAPPTIGMVVAGTDTDNDGTIDDFDDCPEDSTGIADPDADGHCEGDDLFPNNNTEFADSDEDCGLNGIPDTAENAGSNCGDNADQCDESNTYGYTDGDGDGLCATTPSDDYAIDLGADYDDSNADISSVCQLSDSSDSAEQAAYAIYQEACEADIDLDGVLNADDLFPRNGTEWDDTDGDCGGGPFNETTDGNGCGDNSDPDADGDGINALDGGLTLDIDDLDNTKGHDCDGDGVTNLEGDSCDFTEAFPTYGFLLADPDAFSQGPPLFKPVCGVLDPTVLLVPPYASSYQFTPACDGSSSKVGDLPGEPISGEFTGSINGILKGDISFAPFNDEGVTVDFLYEAHWEIDMSAVVANTFQPGINGTLTATNIDCNEPHVLGEGADITPACGSLAAPNFIAGNADGSGAGGIPLDVEITHYPNGDGSGTIYILYDALDYPVTGQATSDGFHTFTITY